MSKKSKDTRPLSEQILDMDSTLNNERDDFVRKAFGVRAKKSKKKRREDFTVLVYDKPADGCTHCSCFYAANDDGDFLCCSCNKQITAKQAAGLAEVVS